MANESPITELLNQFADKCKQVQGVTNALIVYSDEDLRLFVQNATGVNVGVAYGGMKADSEKASGLGANVIVQVFITHPITSINIPVPPSYGLQLLDEVRKQVRAVVSTTGHKIKFVAEVPAAKKDDVLIWMQVWSVPVMLTQGM